MVPPDIIPGRMALLVTLFLVLVNIFNNITTNTPKAEGEFLEGFLVIQILCLFRSYGYRNLDVKLYIVCIRSPNW